MIETICSNCGNKRVFEDSYLGRKFKCPTCGNIVEIKRLEAETALETDEVSNSSVEDAVMQRRQELEEAKQKLADKNRKQQEQREEEDAEIERILKERLENTVEIFKKERRSVWFWSLLYVACVLYFLADPEPQATNAFMAICLFFIGLYLLVGWLVVIIKIVKHRNNKRGWFGDNDDYTFTKECIDSTRKTIIREKYPEREKMSDLDFAKKGDEVKKILYQLEHPEEFK